MAGPDFKRFLLPCTAEALGRRYRGVRVSAERRERDDGACGFTIGFHAESFRVLHVVGLAERDGKTDGLIAPVEIRALGVIGAGSINRDGTAYIYWHCYDGDPWMPGSRTWPPKKTIHTVERILKRVAKSRHGVANG